MFLPIDLTLPLHLPLTRLSSSPLLHSLFLVILILRFFSFFLLLSSLFLFSCPLFSLHLPSIFFLLYLLFWFSSFFSFPSPPFPPYSLSHLYYIPPPLSPSSPKRLSTPPQQTHPPKSLIHPPASTPQHPSPSIPRPTPNTYQQNRKTMSAIGLHYFREEREEKEKDVCKGKECKE